MRLRHVLTGMFTICAAAAISTMAPRAQGLDLPVPDFKPQERTWQENKAINDAKYNKPIYNPETKSYFENYDLYRDPNNPYGVYFAFEWPLAKQWAESRVFHGVRGRLAVIKSREVQEFIAKKLQPDDGAWFGLSFRCDSRSLWWVTGENWPLSAYQNWNRPWNVEGTTWKNANHAQCPPNEVAGVHYWGAATGYKWNVNGPHKGFHYLIIEYTTGKP